MVSPSPELTVWPLKLPMIAVVETKLIFPLIWQGLSWLGGWYINISKQMEIYHEKMKLAKFQPLERNSRR